MHTLNPKKWAVPVSLALTICLQQASATERLFTYTYEPETMPQGASEFEQWVTLRTQRTKRGSVLQENFNRWDLRQEFEYGVTDNYTIGLYLNERADSFRDRSTTPSTDTSSFDWRGISLENRYQVLNPAQYPVGLTLYFEPRYSGEELELEEKIIIGQRCGNWKWAVNLIHATEWAENFHETEAEVEGTFGLSRILNKNWALGLELRSHSELVEYKEWENTTLFLGPAISYRQERWWATLTVLPQIYGKNFEDNPDRNKWLDLAGHERINIRLIFGITF